jgi:DEAD/DEAH box helicase
MELPSHPKLILILWLVCCCRKTVAGEMALIVAFTMQQKHAIYTTPLKALSNQKYADLCPMFGKANVGLSTGDISINKGAPVTVMTTEVYRNIAWRASSGTNDIDNDDDSVRRRSEENDLKQNAVCVLDEFHYMGLPGRGGVWEECVITSPAHTQIVGLSATLPNAPQLAAWMEHVTGRRTVLVNISGIKPRPVPLRYLYATKEGLFPLFRDPEAGPGAPKGLLGLRGDGIVASDKKSTRKKSDKQSIDTGIDEDYDEAKMPRGLQINPPLKAAAEKRLQKVNRAIERKKVQQMRGNFQEDDYGREWGIGRGKRRPMPNRAMSAREEKRERERLLKQELRRSVPSLSILLKRLDQKQLLPAIFFLFSRAGCDEAARNVCKFMRGPACETSIDSPMDPFDGIDSAQQKPKARQSGTRLDSQGKGIGEDFVMDANGRMFRTRGSFVSDEVLEASINEIFQDEAVIDEENPLSKENFSTYAKVGLLGYKQVEIVAAKIQSFNEENPEIAFVNDRVIQFLFGVGSHHAGMLP